MIATMLFHFYQIYLYFSGYNIIKVQESLLHLLIIKIKITRSNKRWTLFFVRIKC